MAHTAVLFAVQVAHLLFKLGAMETKGMHVACASRPFAVLSVHLERRVSISEQIVALATIQLKFVLISAWSFLAASQTAVYAVAAV